MKNILFLAHGNNDLDHFLPLIFKIKKYKIFLIYIPDGNSSYISKAHLSFLKKKQIQIFEIKNFLNSKILIFFLNIFFYLKNLFILNIFNFFFNFILIKINFFLEKILINFISSNILKKNFNNFFLKNSIKLIVTDLFDQEINDTRNIFKKSMSNFLKTAKIMNIPLFMISHGVNIHYHQDNDKKNNSKMYLADSIALCNKYETFLYKHLVKKKKNIKYLGDIRYDVLWIKYLKNLNKGKILSLQKNRKIKILYIMGNLNFLKNRKIEENINIDIFKLANNPEVELWVKIHPRANNKFNFSKLSNIKIYNSEVDVSILLESADVVITTLSGAINSSIIQKKINILFDSWKKELTNPWTIFDKTKCVIKVNNYKDLNKVILQIKDLYKADNKKIENFYKLFISGGRGFKESIIKNYLLEIENLLKEKNVYNKKKFNFS